MSDDWNEGWPCFPHGEKFCTRCNIDIEWSTNIQWRGKPDKLVWNGKTYQAYRGNVVSLGAGWENLSSTLLEFFDCVAEQGWAVGPALVETQDGNRSERTFKSHQVVLVDIDQGMSLDELVENTVYDKYAAGFYTTPSHSDKCHKFRVVFVLDQPITTAIELRRLYTSLILLFGGDTACKDGARLFFGTAGAAVKEFDCSKRLPNNIVRAIIKDVEETEQEILSSTSEPAPVTDEQKQRIVELLKQCDLSTYLDWFRVCTAMKHSGFSIEDFIAVSAPGAACKQYWDRVSENHGVKNSMGTLIWMIRDQLGQDAINLGSVTHKSRVQIVHETIANMKGDLA